MKIHLSTTYTINDGAETSMNVAIDVADDFDTDPSGPNQVAMMSLAADQVIAATRTRGQIMLSTISIPQALTA